MAGETRAHVVLDGYRHMPPAMWLGDRAVMGQFATNIGRYALDDNYHTNGYFVLGTTLADWCAVRQHHGPLTAEALAGCDILVLVNPDYEGYPGHGPPFDRREIAAIHEFVARGGSLLLMLNSYLPVEGDYLWKENYDIGAANEILAPYGLAGGNHVSGDAEVCEVAADDPIFGDVGAVTYGHGGQLLLTPTPGVEHRVHFGNGGRVYCASARTAEGTVLVLADAGLISSGLATLPNRGNGLAARRMFRSLRPAWLQDGWAPAYDVIDLHAVGYPHEGALGPAPFRALNPAAELQPAYNFHYLSAERRSTDGGASIAADAMDVAQTRVELVAVDLLGCELFGFAGTSRCPCG